MSTPYKPHLDRAGFDALHATVARVKAGTKTVTLPAEAVRALLMDHQRLWAITKAEERD